jgi:hypothetical protein
MVPMDEIVILPLVFIVHSPFAKTWNCITKIRFPRIYGLLINTLLLTFFL